jgi:molybdopterin/thiamine biosynthesis adenylyltransferase
MNHIAVIGCGGINSYAIQNLRDIINNFSFDVIVTLFDNDVVEDKNLLFQNQNFVIDDLMEQKAEVLAKRYSFLHNNVFITEENINDLLSAYNIIIIGVDNNKTRKFIYEYCLKHNKNMLDMRAQGTQIMYVVLDKEKSFEEYKEKYFKNNDVLERKGSCQLQSDIDNNHIENGNKIIACLGIYGVLLKMLRGEQLTTMEWKFVY